MTLRETELVLGELECHGKSRENIAAIQVRGTAGFDSSQWQTEKCWTVAISEGITNRFAVDATERSTGHRVTLE